MSKDAEQKARKASTVQLQGGVEYAKVSTRLVEFHEDNSECSIETNIQFQAGENTWVIVTATVTCPRGRFTAHSMDTFKGKQKFLEKLETVAVGRALAFAGYMASGDIASFEEMDIFEAANAAQQFEDAVLHRLRSDFEAFSDSERLKTLLAKVERMTTLDTAIRDGWAEKIRAKINQVANS